MIYDLPQTREMIKGQIAFNENYPGNWSIKIVRLVADGKQATTKILFKDNADEQIGISFFEIDENKIYKIEEYWPVPYDPPIRNFENIVRY